MMVNNVMNWAKIIGSLGSPTCYNSYHRQLALRKIYVKGGVANVCNSQVLVRRAIDAEDGYYLIDPKGDLVLTGTIVEYPYPDIEELMPDFSQMKRVAIPNDTIKALILFVNGIAENETRGVNSRLVTIDSTEFADAHDAKVRFSLPGSPVETQIGLSAQALRFALTEMLLYESVYLAYDNRPTIQKDGPMAEGSRKPKALFLGTDWGHCAMVSATYPRL